MRSSGNGKNVVQLLQSSLLRFRDEEEDHDQSDDVEAPKKLSYR